MRSPREKVGQEMASQKHSKQNTVVRKLNKEYLDELDEFDLFAASACVNAIPDLPNTMRAITDPYPGKEILAHSFMRAMNRVPGSEHEILGKLMSAVQEVLTEDDDAYIEQEAHLIIEIYEGLNSPQIREKKMKAKSARNQKDFWSYLLEPGTFTQIPNILFYKLVFGLRTPLFLLICRQTFGWPERLKDIPPPSNKVYRLCWEWPGNEAVAEILGMKEDRHYISTLRRDLITRQEIIDWGKYVGPNFALLSTTKSVIDFLNEHHQCRLEPESGEWIKRVEAFAEERQLELKSIKTSLVRFYEHTQRLQDLAAFSIGEHMYCSPLADWLFRFGKNDSYEDFRVMPEGW